MEEKCTGKKEKSAIFIAILAAALYALNSPLSKLLLSSVSATTMAGLLYLGAGAGLLIVRLIQKLLHIETNEKKLDGKDLPYTVAMVLLDVAAPIFLMIGLEHTTSANVSLLNNFEIVATSLIALVIFKEKISKRLGVAIILVTVSSIILSVEDVSGFKFSLGSVFVILACICWGFENNCTRKLSEKDPLQIVVVKGFGSGMGSLLIAYVIGEHLPELRYILCAMAVGFVAYGLSIFFYVHAQRRLGAAKTSTYYAVAPFIGVALSLIIFQKIPSVSFWVAIVIMAMGTYLASTE